MAPKIVLEHSTKEEIEGNLVDGMSALLGDDILSSDYDPTFGEWPGVNEITLPPDLDYATRAPVEQVGED